MTIIDNPAHTSNYGARKSGATIIGIVYHDTGGTAKSALNWFANPRAQVSAHYVVARDGTIYRCVGEDKAAWHAGASSWFGYDNLNDWTIGIEIEDSNDTDPYPDAQIASLLELAEDLSIRYRIPLNHHVGHQHVAIPRGRKVDPGPDYPWYDYLVTLGARIAAKELTLKEGP